MYKTVLGGVILCLSVGSCGGNGSSKTSAPDKQPVIAKASTGDAQPAAKDPAVKPKDSVRVEAVRWDDGLPKDKDICMYGMYLQVHKTAMIKDGMFVASISYPKYSHNNYKISTFGRSVAVRAADFDIVRGQQTKRAWFKRLANNELWGYVANPDAVCPKLPGTPSSKLPPDRSDAKLPKDQDVCMTGMYLSVGKKTDVKDGWFTVGISYPKYSHNGYAIGTYGRSLQVKAKYFDAVKKLEGNYAWFKKLKGETLWEHVSKASCPKMVGP